MQPTGFADCGRGYRHTTAECESTTGESGGMFPPGKLFKKYFEMEQQVEK